MFIKAYLHRGYETYVEGIGLCGRELFATYMSKKHNTMGCHPQKDGVTFVLPGDLVECPMCLSKVAEELAKYHPVIVRKFNASNIPNVR